MDSLIELRAEGGWHPAARMPTSARGLRFEYLTDYVFGTGTWPVALSLPVDMTIVSTPLDAPATPLAFLWDLVPQGRGRRHLANLLGVQEHDPTQPLLLAQNGAFAPIGRLRLDTAHRFYAPHLTAPASPGFTLTDIVQCANMFCKQLATHTLLPP